MSIFTQIQRGTVMAAAAMLLLTGCGLTGASAPDSAETTDRAAPVEMKAEPAKESAAAEPAPGVADDVSAGEVAVLTEMAAKSEAETAPAVAATAAMPVDTDSPDAAFEREADETSIAAPQQSPPLRAGEVNDNVAWDDYLLYRRNYAGPPIHNYDISERYVIEVTNGQGNPVLGANVSVALPGQRSQEIFSAVTPANGQVLFHPLAQNVRLDGVDQFLVTVTQDNAHRQFTLSRFNAQQATGFSDRWTVSLDSQRQAANSIDLDVLFLLDATGSMADEIAKIQSTIFDVSAQIDSLPTRPDVRYGLVTYRDRDDSFVTHSYPFTPDVRDFSANLNMVRADGGGDYPESLNEALHNALHNVEWRGSNAVKLIFLIADAPPHLDYPQDYDYAVEMNTAAQRGIKIFSIASSGLDDQGEYIFRQMAQATQGRFIFLTYDGPTNGGAPGDVTTHHVDDYSVENLDRLLVRLVEEELAFQNPQWVLGQ